jgi:hypothetical protein
MIRIVGVQRSEVPNQEFVLLQNQGNMRELLRGRALIEDGAFHEQSGGIHLFADDVRIGPGQFVMLRSCVGEPHWGTSKDGAIVYFTYAGRKAPIWSTAAQAVHLLSADHTHTPRVESAVVV